MSDLADTPPVPTARAALTSQSRLQQSHSAKSRIAFAVALLAIVAFWGATFPIVKNATREFSVLGFLALRFAVAACALAPFAIGKLTWSCGKIGFCIGLVLITSYVLQTFGLRYTTSSNAGIITGMFIVFVPITGWFLFRTKTGWWLWLGIALSVAGLLILTDSSRLGFQRGDMLALLCAAGFGLHVTLLDRYAVAHNALALSFFQLIIGSALAAALWPVYEEVRMPLPAEWAAILATALVGSALALFVQTSAQQRLSAVSAALIIMTEPVFAAVFSQWMLGERLSAVQWGGAALMMLAMVFVGTKPRHGGT